MGKQKKFELQKGVTLIVLVITILVLLILAGVGIAMITGENGIIEKARVAKERTEEKKVEEEGVLKGYEEMMEGKFPEISEEKLPENGEGVGAGTLVKMPTEWYTKVAAGVSPNTGKEIETVKKVANVYAVSDGKAETIPVPYGFYYVGGTLESGVVISDNEKDRDKYVGQNDVPAGVIYNADGTVKTYTDEEYKNLSEDEKKAILLGNQFVWIPCTESNYKKENFGKTNNTGWDTTTNSAELIQIQKYGGFYVGRYEAGTSEIKLAGGVEFGKTSTSTDWQNGNYVSSKVESGKITSKAGEIPYYHADYITALEMTNNMYNTETVKSGLITGTMWDVMMKYITTDNSGYSDLKSSPWGNYSNNTIVAYTAGRGRYLAVNSSNGSVTSNATVSDARYHYGIRTTASSEGVKKNNLYDVAGNVWEWTTESCYVNNINELLFNLRGGSFDNSYSGRPVCFRVYDCASHIYTNNGFRPALYIK